CRHSTGQRRAPQRIRFLEPWCSRHTILAMAGGEMISRTNLCTAAAIVLFLPLASNAQTTDADLGVLRLLGVPVSALPPISLQMPASRNHNYFFGKLQAGYRKGPSGDAMPAFAGGIDFQYRGGSVIGVTAGYQKRDCGTIGVGCGGHALFGVRSQINLVTGGSIFAGLLKDNTATSTLGTEIGIGYAPKVAGDLNACAIDMGIPHSVAKRRQRPRLVAYVSPGVVWDFYCGSRRPP